MSEQRPILGRITQSDTENNGPSESQAAETQLRQALEHMGGRRLNLGSNANNGSGSALNRGHGTGSAQRHRYVRDGEVPVVHAALGRQSGRTDTGLQQDKALIDQLRLDLDRERAVRETAERSLHETRASLTAIQTRLAHVEMDLQAAHEQIAARAAVQQTVETPNESPAPVRRRPRLERIVEDPEDEPQPVKWWIKDE